MYTISKVFSNDGALVASILLRNMRTIQIWKVDEGRLLQKLEGHKEQINAMAFSQSSNQLASLSGDQDCKIWDVRSGVCLKTVRLLGDIRFRGAIFSYDLTRLAAFTAKRRDIEMYDVNSGVRLQTFIGHAPGDGFSRGLLAFSRDSSLLASGSGGKTIKIWDATSMTGPRSGIPRDVVEIIALSPDPKKIAAASNSGIISIWDISSGDCMKPFTGHDGRVTRLNFLHCSNLLVSHSTDQAVKVWDVKAGACLHTFATPAIPASSGTHLFTVSAVSQTSGLLATVRSGYPTTMCSVWNMITGACLCTLDVGLSGDIQHMTFSCDSSKLGIVSETGEVRIWNVHAGMLMSVMKTRLVSQKTPVVFSEDCSLLAIQELDGKITILDTSSGNCVQRLAHVRWRFRSMALSSVTNRLAVVASGGVIRIWDIRNSECFHTIRIQVDLSGISFDATGSYLSTRFGDIDLSFMSDFRSAAHDNQPEMPVYRAAGVSPDMTWLMYKGRRLLWLPTDYRPSKGKVTVSGDTVALTSSDSRMQVVHFIPDELPS
jgi:WD40 repeat protein